MKVSFKKVKTASTDWFRFKQIVDEGKKTQFGDLYLSSSVFNAEELPETVEIELLLDGHQSVETEAAVETKKPRGRRAKTKPEEKPVEDVGVTEDAVDSGDAPEKQTRLTITEGDEEEQEGNNESEEDGESEEEEDEDNEDEEETASASNEVEEEKTAPVAHPARRRKTPTAESVGTPIPAEVLGKGKGKNKNK